MSSRVFGQRRSQRRHETGPDSVPGVPQGPTLEWLGCATFRLRLRGLTLFFDSYLDGDRAPSAPLVGLRATDVTDADFVFVSHAHFDHMLGADTIAARTGATVVGSYEVARILTADGLPGDQILRVSGGEPVDCGHGVRIRAFPSLHSCLYASGSRDSATECVGHLGISAQQRDAATMEMFSLVPSLGEPVAGWADRNAHRSSPRDGGQLSYLIESPDGCIFVSSSAGYWSGIIADLRPDLAILAASGRPNINGEPYQGSLAHFLLAEVELLRPHRIVFSHHDALMPPLLTETDTGEAAAVLAAEANYAPLLTLPYNDAVPILR